MHCFICQKCVDLSKGLANHCQQVSAVSILDQLLRYEAQGQCHHCINTQIGLYILSSASSIINEAGKHVMPTNRNWVFTYALESHVAKTDKHNKQPGKR